MCFGLIGAGLGIAQQVMGMVGQAKAAKGGGEEQKAEAPKDDKAAKADGAGGGDDAKKEEANPIDRFIGLLGNAKSINDIKNLRDQALAAVKPEQKENAKRKLDQAILQKLGLGEPGPNGDMIVKLTPQAQQILQQLGMKPDEVKDGAAADGPAPGPAAPPIAGNAAKPPLPA